MNMPRVYGEAIRPYSSASLPGSRHQGPNSIPLSSANIQARRLTDLWSWDVGAHLVSRERLATTPAGGFIYVPFPSTHAFTEGRSTQRVSGLIGPPNKRYQIQLVLSSTAHVLTTAAIVYPDPFWPIDVQEMLRRHAVFLRHESGRTLRSGGIPLERVLCYRGADQGLLVFYPLRHSTIHTRILSVLWDDPLILGSEPPNGLHDLHSALAQRIFNRYQEIGQQEHPDVHALRITQFWDEERRRLETAQSELEYYAVPSRVFDPIDSLRPRRGDAEQLLPGLGPSATQSNTLLSEPPLPRRATEHPEHETPSVQQAAQELLHALTAHRTRGDHLLTTSTPTFGDSVPRAAPENRDLIPRPLSIVSTAAVPGSQEQYAASEPSTTTVIHAPRTAPQPPQLSDSSRRRSGTPTPDQPTITARHAYAGPVHRTPTHVSTVGRTTAHLSALRGRLALALGIIPDRSTAAPTINRDRQVTPLRRSADEIYEQPADAPITQPATAPSNDTPDDDTQPVSNGLPPNDTPEQPADALINQPANALSNDTPDYDTQPVSIAPSHPEIEISEQPTDAPTFQPPTAPSNEPTNSDTQQVSNAPSTRFRDALRAPVTPQSPERVVIWTTPSTAPVYDIHTGRLTYHWGQPERPAPTRVVPTPVVPSTGRVAAPHPLSLRGGRTTGGFGRGLARK